MHAEGVSVRSVLGPVAVPAGAFVDAHAHTWIDAPAEARAAGLPALTEAAAVERELAAFAAAGGAALIDCQPPFCGRDLQRLRRCQRATGVAIVACTGFHLPAWYAPGAPPWAWPVERAQARFADELAVGDAGAVKAAHDGGAGDPRVQGLLEAAARAATAARVPLVVHTERGAAVEAAAELLIAAGAEPGRVLLCHVDKRPDVALHAELARAGFRLEYDTFVRPKYAPDAGVWPLLEAMLAAGHAESIAVGLDLADPALWAFGGGPGPRALTHDIPARLRALGVAEPDVLALCGGNALELLAPPVREGAR
jgi:phosphotriesterase-related protein